MPRPPDGTALLRRPRGTFACDDAAIAAPRCACGSPAVHALHARLDADMSRRMVVAGGAAALLAPLLGVRAERAAAQRPDPPAGGPRRILFTDLRLFDGASEGVRGGVNVLVEGKKVAALPPAAERVADADVVACGGRLLMPGLIDAHWHAAFAAIPELVALTADAPYVHLVAAREAGRTLMRGFTAVRDAGGPTFALKRAIDEGIVDGPRIYPAGAMVSQTSGHGDFRMRHEVPRSGATPLSHAEQTGVSAIADGEAEVLRRVREQLMLGASQVKLMAGGGASSLHDPLDTTQYSERELRAGVEAAEDWGTYAMAHVYTPRGIQRALRAGVKSIEHGQLADEESARMMAGEGAWWSLQPFLVDEDSNLKADPVRRAKQAQVAEGTERAYALAKAHRVNTAWGTDILFAPQNLPHHARQLAKLTPRFYAPLDLLRIATGRNGELLGLSGPRNPYDGRIGVIAPGALADLLVADGDPAASLDFLTDPAANLRVIMKDGRMHKNTLP